MTAPWAESEKTLTAYQRLVILLPNRDVNEVKISRFIRSLASQGNGEVLLLSLAKNDETELPARRRLATIFSLVRGPKINVRAHISLGKSWIKAIQKNTEKGDLIVCPAEIDISTGFTRKEPLPEVIGEKLSMPVYVFEDYYTRESSGWIRIVKQALFWIVTLAIFIGFFKLETEVDLYSRGWLSQFILIVLIFLEAGAIYMWSSISGL